MSGAILRWTRKVTRLDNMAQPLYNTVKEQLLQNTDEESPNPLRRMRYLTSPSQWSQELSGLSIYRPIVYATTFAALRDARAATGARIRVYSPNALDGTSFHVIA